jgi:heme/copper-type cytochrome/quinol oxidase subunit 3
MSQRAASHQPIAEPERKGFASMGMPSLVDRAPEWAPEVDARLGRVGMRIWIGADVFFFVAWFFAFFYLRALNNNHDWTPSGVGHPNRTIGAAILLLVLVSAGLYWMGTREVGARAASARMLLWLALIAGILSFVVQMYEFQHLGFDPQLGTGYASVFVGLKAVWLFQLVGALFWMATQIAQTRPNGDAMIRPASAANFANFMIFLAGIGLVSYLVLYFF